MQYKLRLKLLDRFTCIGTDCPDTCCQSWDIELDNETIQKWKSEVSDEDRQQLIDGIRYVNKKGKSVAVLAHRSDNHCVHLNDDGLCRIQVSYGHDFIPANCRDYPRTQVDEAGISFHSFALSCPETVRLLLEAPEQEDLFDDQSVHLYGEQDYTSFCNKLENMITWVFRCRDTSLNTKNYYFASLAGGLVEVSTDSEPDIFSSNKLLKNSEDSVCNTLGTLNKKCNKLVKKPNKYNCGEFWNAALFLLEKRLRDLPAEYLRENGFISQLLEYSHDPADSDKKNIMKISNMVLGQYHLLDKYEGLLQRPLSMYLRLSFKNTGFCWKPVGGNFSQAFLHVIIRYTVIKLLMLNVIKENNKLSEVDILNVIYRVERAMAHNNDINYFLERNQDFLWIENYSDAFLFL